MYYFACPSCDNRASFYRVHRDSGGMNLAWILLIIGQTLPALLLMNYEKRLRVQCGQCGYMFVRPRIKTSPVGTAVAWLLLCVVLAVGWAACTEFLPGPLPGAAYAEMIQAWVEQHSLAVAWGLMVGLPSLLLVAVVATAISNWLQRRQVRRQYQHEPIERPVLSGDADGGSS